VPDPTVRNFLTRGEAGSAGNKLETGSAKPKENRDGKTGEQGNDRRLCRRGGWPCGLRVIVFGSGKFLLGTGAVT